MTTQALLLAALSLAAFAPWVGAVPMDENIQREGLRVRLVPEQDMVMVTHGPAEWTLRCASPGMARIGMGAGVHVLGAGGGVPIRWRREGQHRITGRGSVPNVGMGFRVDLALHAGARLRCTLTMEGSDVGKIAWVDFPPSPVVRGPSSRLVVPQWLGLLVSPEGPEMRVRRGIWTRPLSMRFIGATQPGGNGERSCVAILGDSLYRSVDIWRSAGEAGFEYIGEPSFAERSSLRRTQSLEFQFLKGNYVAIAQRYREWACRQRRQEPGSL